MGNIIIPNRPDGKLSQISNIPLTCPSVPGSLKILKGCEFNPPVTLNRNELYFIVVSNRARYVPQPGWYDVVDKGYLTWIKDFELLQVSHRSITGTAAWVFKAIEGPPPVGIDLKGGEG